MSPLRLWFGLFSLLAVGAVAPAWVYWAGPRAAGLPIQTEFMVALALPAIVMLTVASWVGGG